MLKSAGEIFLSGLRGANIFSNTFRIAFRIFFRVFQTVFRIDLKVFSGAVSFCRHAALSICVTRDEKSARNLSDRSFSRTSMRHVRAKMPVFQGFGGPDRSFSRMSAGTSVRKLPLWADFTFLSGRTVATAREERDNVLAATGKQIRMQPFPLPPFKPSRSQSNAGQKGLFLTSEAILSLVRLFLKNSLKRFLGSSSAHRAQDSF